MYGVSSDLARHLEQFRGTTLTEIGVGEFILQFRFANGLEPLLAVEGEWELRGPDGAVLDRQQPNAERACFRAHVLLGRAVEGYEVRPPDALRLVFAGGYELWVFDRSRQYESFSIQPGDVFV